MSNYVHIVFGDSGAGSLKHYFSTNKSPYSGEVINLFEDFSVGPIYHLEDQDYLEKRLFWVETMFNLVSPGEGDLFKKEFYQAYKMIHSISERKKIVVWYGENTSDYIGLRYVIKNCDYNENIYCVNVTQSCDLNNAIVYNGGIALGACTLEEINQVIHHIKKVTRDDYNQLINEWNQLSNSKGDLRIFENSKIIDVDSTYYDSDILNYCTHHFVNYCRVIGNTLGHSAQLIGDLFVDFRIRKLIDNNKIEVKGNLKNIRNCEIKKMED
jgi:hypothetical protein